MTDERLVALAKENPNCGAFEILLSRYRRVFYHSINTFYPKASVQQIPEIMSRLHEVFWRAVRLYDPTKEIKFSTYVWPFLMASRIYQEYFKKEVVTISMPMTNHAKDTPIEIERYDLPTDYRKSLEELGVGASKDFSDDVEFRIDFALAFRKLKTERRKEFVSYLASGYVPQEYARAVGLSPSRGSQIANDTFKQLREELCEYE